MGMDVDDIDDQLGGRVRRLLLGTPVATGRGVFPAVCREGAAPDCHESKFEGGTLGWLPQVLQSGEKGDCPTTSLSLPRTCVGVIAVEIGTMSLAGWGLHTSSQVVGILGILLRCEAYRSEAFRRQFVGLEGKV